jgi:hypothetical protein
LKKFVFHVNIVEGGLPGGMNWCRKVVVEVGRVEIGEKFALVKTGQISITSVLMWHAGVPSVLGALAELGTDR